MSVIDKQSPSGFGAVGKKAHIVHAGVMMQVQSVEANEEKVAGNGQLAVNGLTRDRWVPYDTEFTDPADLNGDDWSLSGATVDVTGSILSEDTSNAVHRIEQTLTVAAAENVLAFTVERRDAPEVQLQYQDSAATQFRAIFDLRDNAGGGVPGSIGTIAAGTNAEIRYLGNNRFNLVIRFTPAAGAGTARIQLTNGDGDFTAGNTVYTGLERSVKVEDSVLHESFATLKLFPHGVAANTVLCIGAHNLWSGANAFVLEAQTAGGGYSTVASINASDLEKDSPIMCFFNETSGDDWRLVIRHGMRPEVGVVRLGGRLVMDRPFYQGFSPSRMNRQTELNANLSRSGELLGRSKVRTILQESYQWRNLPYSWVRANLDGPLGLIQSMEADSAFIAWRPSEVPEDTSYIMRAEPGTPQASGPRDLWSFDMSAEVYSYE